MTADLAESRHGSNSGLRRTSSASCAISCLNTVEIPDVDWLSSLWGQPKSPEIHCDDREWTRMSQCQFSRTVSDFGRGRKKHILRESGSESRGPTSEWRRRFKPRPSDDTTEESRGNTAVSAISPRDSCNLINAYPGMDQVHAGTHCHLRTTPGVGLHTRCHGCQYLGRSWSASQEA